MRRLCSINSVLPCPVCPGLLLAVILFAAIGVMQAWGCEHEPAAGDAPAAETTAASGDEAVELTALHYEIDGMTCTGCAQSIHRKIADIAGVERCDVSYEDGSADVDVRDPELAAAIEDAVAGLGYTIVSGPDTDDA